MNAPITLIDALAIKRLFQASNPLNAQLADRPFPQVAAAVRDQAGAIALTWVTAVREATPHIADLTFDELGNSTPEILLALADALASNDPAEIRRMMSRSSILGVTWFQTNVDVIDVMQENRLLRSIIVQHVEARLGRQMDVAESAALHTAIGLMLKQFVVGIVNRRRAQLREAAEAELKYLSFLSHDLNNNLGNITLFLTVLQEELKGAKGFNDATNALQDAQQAIQNTVGGMRQILDHARLQSGAFSPTVRPVSLDSLVTFVVAQHARKAQLKGVTFVVEATPCEIVNTNVELVTLVLQNLVGNAVKYSSNGRVRIQSKMGKNASQCVLRVSDEGPGIKAEDKARIFDAFQRGEVCGQEGVGLGLAIASHAAKLLNAELTVESEVGKGSTFQLAL